MARRAYITKDLVDSLKPEGREYISWDDEIQRFGVRVRPTGGKHYVLRLRVDGRQRWYTIGAHGDPWTPKSARDEANRVLGLAAHVTSIRGTGQAPANLRHPIEAREVGKSIPTLEEFSKDYMRDHARPHKRASSADADEGNLRRTILPALGGLKLTAISHAAVVRFHMSRKDHPTNANRCLALLSHMFAMAQRWGRIPEGTNPCRHVGRFPEAKRERFLSTKELGRLGAALAAAEKKGKVTPFGLAAIRLLIFTGARASEVLGLTDKHLDFAAGAIRIQESKTGPKTIMLNPPAAAVLSKLPKVKGNPYRIAGDRKGKPLTLSGLEQVWQTVREAAALDDVRLHDLRHSFASVAVAGGASLPMIGKLLGHTRPETTARYAHLAADPLKAASDAVAATIEAAMGPRRKRNNLTAMGRA